MDKYRLNQALNLFKNKIDVGQKLKWVYIYGHHRGGTTYSLNQFLKVSKRGTGDWMMHQFAEAFIAAQNRTREKLNTKKLRKNFRRNLMSNAQLGGGQKLDIVIKQAVGIQDVDKVKLEINFFTELFKSKPTELIFLYREPHGYWRSAKKKFSQEDERMFVQYRRAFEAYKENGGRAIEYGKELENYFKNHNLFKKISVDNFSPKTIKKIKGLEIAEEDFNNFISHLDENV